MSTLPLHEIPQQLRTEAEKLRTRYLDERLANFADLVAGEIERALNGSLLEPLTITQSMQLGGYSRSALNRLIRDKVIPNAGTKTEPKILRCNVPIKPGHGVVRAPDLSVQSRDEVARAVASGRKTA